MKHFLKLFIILLGVGVIVSCQEDEPVDQPELTEVSSEMLDKIEKLGFSPNDVKRYDQQYFVEGDIMLTEAQINQMTSGFEIPGVEHYSTTNLVTGTPRTVSVFVNMPQKYKDATNIAINRYNSENLNLTFQQVSSSSGADIVIRASPWYYRFYGILGSAGFPTAGGDPYNTILMTRAYYDGVSNINGLATTIAHEMGHCIGFRHTDYMDRSFSCGGSPSNEGPSDVGANYIPGTPTGPDANSWMLACGSPEGDRPFTANDVTALEYLY